MQESVFSMPVVVGESSIDILGHVNKPRVHALDGGRGHGARGFLGLEL